MLQQQLAQENFVARLVNELRTEFTTARPEAVDRREWQMELRTVDVALLFAPVAEDGRQPWVKAFEAHVGAIAESPPPAGAVSAWETGPDGQARTIWVLTLSKGKLSVFMGSIGVPGLVSDLLLSINTLDPDSVSSSIEMNSF